MIKKIITYWETKIRFNFKVPLHKIDDRCCNSNIKVIDFDRVKDEFSADIKTDNAKLKSVDLVKYHKRKNSLCLIEMKGHDGGSDKLEFIQQKIEETIPKIIDSIILLTAIMGYHRAKRKWYFTFVNPKQLQIIPYILVNYSDADLVPLIAATKDQRSIKLSGRIQQSIQLINCDGFENLFDYELSS